MKTYKIIAALCLSIGLLAGHISAQESDKSETKVKLIAEKNGKQEVFEKTIPGIKNSFNKEEIETLFGIQKANYDKFIVKIECNKTVTKEKGDNNLKVMVEGDKSDSEEFNINSTGDNTKMIIVTKKDGKTEKKVIDREGKLNDAEIEKLLKENGIEMKISSNGTMMEVNDGDKGQVKVIHMNSDKNNDGKTISKKIIIKTDKDGKLNDEDMKSLKEQGVEVNIEDKGDNNKMTRKTVIVKINLVDITKGDIENANKNGARLSVNSPELKVEQLSFYPNPNNGKFNLSFTLPNKGNTIVSVFDLVGREVYHEERANYSGNYNKEIDLTQENKGTYLIQVQQNGSATTKKLVVE